MFYFLKWNYDISAPLYDSVYYRILIKFIIIVIVIQWYIPRILVFINL